MLLLAALSQFMATAEECNDINLWWISLRKHAIDRCMYTCVCKLLTVRCAYSNTMFAALKKWMEAPYWVWNVRACFSSPFDRVDISSHDVKQMVPDAGKVSETDVIGQINAWRDTSILDLIRLNKVQGLLRLDKDVKVMLEESGMHLNRPYEGILTISQRCVTVRWSLRAIIKLYYILWLMTVPVVWHHHCSMCWTKNLKTHFVLTHSSIDYRHPCCRKLIIFSKKHLAVINYFSTTPQTVPTISFRNSSVRGDQSPFA